jgi:hypothetical protein
MLQPSNRELHALRNLISEADLILKTSPALPENRTQSARALLCAGIALIEDFIEQSKLSPAVSLGRKGGTVNCATLWLRAFSPACQGPQEQRRR